MKFEEIMQKTINTESKTSLTSSTMVRNLDIHCPKDYRFFNSIVSKVQTQGTTIKDFLHPEEPKVKEAKFVCANAAEFSEPTKKKKKQKSLNTSENALKNQKKPRPLATMPLLPLKKLKEKM